MDIVKKNILSILCVVVALVAIASLFFPTAGMYETLQSEVTQSAAAYPTLTDLRTKSTRTRPPIDPSEAEPQALGLFPTETVIAQGQSIVDRRAAVAKNILDLALKRNRKEPLVPGSLPDAGSGSRAAFDFRQVYRRAINADGDPSGPSVFRKLLKATTPPSPEEIQRAADQTAQSIQQQELRYVGNQPTNADEVNAKITDELKDLPDRLRQQRASQNRIYVTPGTFAPQPAITGGGAPDAEQIFNAQMMYWTQQEVAEAIANADAGATSVLDAPVKHLLSLGIPVTFAAPGTGGAAAAPAEGAAPAEVTINKAAAITPNYQAGPTGRPDHTPLYDAVRFPMVVRVEAAKIPQVLNALSANRLLTVTVVDVTALDGARALAEGYVYGDQPVAELQVQCELLFLREWLVPLMPASVKASIAAAEAAQAAAATGEQ